MWQSFFQHQTSWCSYIHFQNTLKLLDCQQLHHFHTLTDRYSLIQQHAHTYARALETVAIVLTRTQLNIGGRVHFHMNIVKLCTIFFLCVSDTSFWCLSARFISLYVMWMKHYFNVRFICKMNTVLSGSYTFHSFT